MPEIRVRRGSAKLVGISDNFYNVNPPELPKGWDVKFQDNTSVSRVACIYMDYDRRKAGVSFDKKLFNDKNIPDGCKVFMVFHEIGHIIHGPDEQGCDWFACEHSLRAGVSPFLCYLAVRAFMPEHYADRILAIANKLLIKYPHLSDV